MERRDASCLALSFVTTMSSTSILSKRSLQARVELVTCKMIIPSLQLGCSRKMIEYNYIIVQGLNKQ